MEAVSLFDKDDVIGLAKAADPLVSFVLYRLAQYATENFWGSDDDEEKEEFEGSFGRYGSDSSAGGDDDGCDGGSEDGIEERSEDGIEGNEEDDSEDEFSDG